MVAAAVPRAVHIRVIPPSASAAARTACPISAVRPVDPRSILAQRSLHKSPLVRAHHILIHANVVGRRRAPAFVGKRQEESIHGNGALLGRVSLRAPCAQKSRGRLPRHLWRGRRLASDTHHRHNRYAQNTDRKEVPFTLVCPHRNPH